MVTINYITVDGIKNNEDSRNQRVIIKQSIYNPVRILYYF